MAGKISIETDITGREQEWNEFVESSANGSLFQRIDFLSYHPEDRFDEHPLMFYYGGHNLLGVLPLALSEENGTTVARSPYGGSYGGFVIEPDMKFRYVNEIMDILVDHLAELGVEKLIVRPTPREQHTHPTGYTEFHLSHRGAIITDRELTNVIDLTRISEDRFDIYERSCRSKIRKSEREGIEIEEWSDDWENFHEILVKTQARHDNEPTHTKAELKRLNDLFPERTRLCMAYHDRTPVAGIFEFLINDRVNFHFYNCHLTEHRDLAPVNRLLDREIEWSVEQGYDFLDLGTTVENFEWNDGLIRFKESFGATGQLRDVYELSI